MMAHFDESKFSAIDALFEGSDDGPQQPTTTTTALNPLRTTTAGLSKKRAGLGADVSTSSSISTNTSTRDLSKRLLKVGRKRARHGGYNDGEVDDDQEDEGETTTAQNNRSEYLVVDNDDENEEEDEESVFDDDETESGDEECLG